MVRVVLVVIGNEFRDGTAAATAVNSMFGAAAAVASTTITTTTMDAPTTTGLSVVRQVHDGHDPSGAVMVKTPEECKRVPASSPGLTSPSGGGQSGDVWTSIALHNDTWRRSQGRYLGFPAGGRCPPDGPANPNGGVRSKDVD